MIEFLKNTKCSSIDETTEKWTSFGFLGNVKNKQNAALACENTFQYLTDNVEKYHGEIYTLVFPVMVRCFGDIEENLTIEPIYNKVVFVIDEFYSKLNEIEKTDEWVNKSENRTTDVELDFIVNFSEEIKTKL